MDINDVYDDFTLKSQAFPKDYLSDLPCIFIAKDRIFQPHQILATSLYEFAVGRERDFIGKIANEHRHLTVEEECLFNKVSQRLGDMKKAS